MNNATCIDRLNNFSCSCSPLYTGNFCEMEIDVCASEMPCENNGVCTPLVTDGFPSFECSCIGPFTGDRCAVFDPCVEEPCLNNGVCIFGEFDESYRCNCSSPYTSTDCEVIDACMAYSPCLNGATCTIILPSPSSSLTRETVNSTFQCTCADGFTGINCETIITPCFFVPCLNNGVCNVDASSEFGYTCNCPVGFQGQNCDQGNVCVQGNLFTCFGPTPFGVRSSVIHILRKLYIY